MSSMLLHSLRALVVGAATMACVSSLSWAETIPFGTTVVWSGNVEVTESVHVYGRLEVEPATHVTVSGGPYTSIAVHEGGVMVVDGTATGKVVFQAPGSPSTRDAWHGIFAMDGGGGGVYPSIVSISHAVIQNANFGVGSWAGLVMVNDTMFHKCKTGGMIVGYGTYSYPARFRECIATMCDTGFESLAEVDIEGCAAHYCSRGFKLAAQDHPSLVFRNNLASYNLAGDPETDAAIWVLGLGDGITLGPDVVVENNSGTGILCNRDTYLVDSKVLNNGGNGIWSTGNEGEMWVTGCEIRGNFNNVVSDSATGQVHLGEGVLYGGNTITDPVRYHVINNAPGTLMAENCYWGGEPGSLPRLQLIGSVDVMPFLLEDPFGF